MEKIIFKICVCGMSDENFAENIMIYKPQNTYEKSFCFAALTENGIIHMSEFLEHIKENSDILELHLGNTEKQSLNYQDVYINRKDCLLGLREDKTISEIFEYFGGESLEIVYIIAGGASIHHRGYLFTVHTDEKIHKNTPHVHVEKNDMSVRYLLDGFKRFGKEKTPREFKRDEKKIILPALRANREELIRMWKDYNEGFDTPKIDENGKQYYKES